MGIIETDRHKSGTLSFISVDGEEISNSMGKKIIQVLDGLFFDAKKDEWVYDESATEWKTIDFIIELIEEDAKMKIVRKIEIPWKTQERLIRRFDRLSWIDICDFARKGGKDYSWSEAKKFCEAQVARFTAQGTVILGADPEDRKILADAYTRYVGVCDEALAIEAGC